MLITWAPWSAAQTIPSAMSAALPEPLPPITLTGISEHSAQAPTPPRPLFERAAITPATSVPCPWSSSGSASSLTASQPETNEPWRSGWLRSTPVSRTATTTSAAPSSRARRPELEPWRATRSRARAGRSASDRRRARGQRCLPLRRLHRLAHGAGDVGGGVGYRRARVERRWPGRTSGRATAATTTTDRSESAPSRYRHPAAFSFRPASGDAGAERRRRLQTALLHGHRRADDLAARRQRDAPGTDSGSGAQRPGEHLQSAALEAGAAEDVSVLQTGARLSTVTLLASTSPAAGRRGVSVSRMEAERACCESRRSAAGGAG